MKVTVRFRRLTSIHYEEVVIEVPEKHQEYYEDYCYNEMKLIAGKYNNHYIKKVTK